jgi:hypothetical protein
MAFKDATTKKEQNKNLMIMSNFFWQLLKRLKNVFKFFAKNICLELTRFFGHIEYSQSGQMQIDLSKIITILGCNILSFYRGVHVWTYPTSNFWKNFIKLLHIMLKHNLNKILKKKPFHFIL